MATFNIEITSDTVCPWCMIGYKRLSRAILAYQSKQGEGASSFQITWKPFYLNPKAPEPSIPKAQAYAQKFGPARAEQILGNLARVGEMEDIHFRFGGNTGRTRDSHRVIAWAAKQDSTPEGKDATGTATLQNRVAEQIFASYFEKEEDITQHGILVNAYLRAVAVHSPDADQNEAKAKVEQLLASSELGYDVDNEAELARRGGVNGVPYFVINDRFDAEGGQEPAAFVALFEKIAKLEARNGL